MRRQTSGLDPERVRLGLRRMVVGRVERREVVVLELDLGALGDAEAETDEDVLDLALDLRQQVRGATRHGIARQRHVDRLGAQRGVELACLELLAQPARAASRARRARGSAPGRALRAARTGRAPSSRSASVSALERPSASTRASSSSAAVVARSSCSRPWRSRLAASSMDIPASMQGRGRLPRGTTLLAPSGASRFRPFVGVPPGSGGELRRTVHAGALSHGPAPSSRTAPAYSSPSAPEPPFYPRVRRAAAAPGGEPYERLGPALRPLVRGRRPRHRVLRARLRGRRGPRHRARRGQRADRGRARASRPPRDRARRGARRCSPRPSAAHAATTSPTGSRSCTATCATPPPLPASDRVIAPFRTFMHLSGDDERRSALRAAAGLLARRRAVRLRRLRAERRRHPRDPRPLDRAPRGHQRAPPVGCRGAPPRARRPPARPRRPMTLEWRSACEWRALVAEAGLELLAAYAGFEGAELADQTGDQVYVCERRAGYARRSS